MRRRVFLLLALLSVLAIPAFAQSKPVITVLDFKTDGVSDKEMRSIIELLSSALFNTGKFQVIDVTQRETLLKEVEFSSSDCSDESCQLKMGQMLAAELIVVGNIGKVGSRFLVSAKMLETETARTHSSAEGIYASLDEVVDALPNMAKKLAGVSTETSAATATASTTVTKPAATEQRPETAAKPAATAQAAKPANGKLIGGIVAVVTGLAAGGVGGYLIYNAATAGKAAVDAAQGTYRATSETNATDNWNALVAAVGSMKTGLYAGIASAGGGVLLAGLGTVLLLLPSKPASPAATVSMNFVPQGKLATLSFSISY